MSLDLSVHIAALENLGLIRPVMDGAALEYRFRHALVHDAAYSTMLRLDRRRLHHAVGEVLEREPVLAGDDLDPLLGRHFYEAGDLLRASRYFGRAGDSAAHKYAHAEALAYYSQAIQAAEEASHPAGDDLPSPPLARLFQNRGHVHELQGRFDESRADYERSAQAARAAASQADEWQALLSLALLWAERDYDRSGAYCQQALELAEQMGEPVLLARSYNRLGNWRLNIDQPREAVRYHQQALAIFQSLQDDGGMAETLDLLGMSSMLGGQSAHGAGYYQQAIELNQRLGEHLALAACQASQLLTATGTYQTLTTRPSPLALRDLQAQGEQAVRVMRESGWRAGEAFTSFILSYYHLSHGHYAGAFSAAQQGLETATSIGHQQWLAASHYAFGMLYLDLLAWPRAIQSFEIGLGLSREVGSRHWINTHLGLLGLTYVECGDLAKAGQVLGAADGLHQPPQSLGQRLIEFARARLAQARGQPDEALGMVEELFASAEAQIPGQPETSSPPLLLLRGQLLAGAGRAGEAEADLRAGASAAAAYGERCHLWRLQAALARLLQSQGRAGEADEAREQARLLIAALADEVPQLDLRENFRLAAERSL